MEGYIVNLVCVSVFCGIVCFLAPSDGNIKNHIKLITSIAVLCVALFPLGDFLFRLKNIDLSALEDMGKESLEADYEAMFCDAIKEYSEESVASACKNLLKDKFDLNDDDIDIIISSSVENDKINVDKATVIVYFSAITEDPDPLLETVEKMLNCECQIIYK